MDQGIEKYTIELVGRDQGPTLCREWFHDSGPAALSEQKLAEASIVEGACIGRLCWKVEGEKYIEFRNMPNQRSVDPGGVLWRGLGTVWELNDTKLTYNQKTARCRQEM